METRTLSRNEMDRLVDEHFRAEQEVRIPDVLATYTDTVEHDIAGSPAVLHGKAAVGAMYTEMFRNLAIDEIVPVRRYYGDDFMVDESIIAGRANGPVGGIDGRGRPVRFRLLHIFEFRDGLIDRENAWLDLATIHQQLA